MHFKRFKKTKRKNGSIVQPFFVNRHYDDVMLGLISQILLGYYILLISAVQALLGAFQVS